MMVRAPSQNSFGLHYVDYDSLERIPKSFAKWYKEVVEHNGID
ncbi:MAG: family 1 glycosylhydrolase [Cyclobacteriaceae bacterium]